MSTTGGDWAYSEVGVFDNGEESGYVLISEGGSGGEVIVLSHHLDTCRQTVGEGVRQYYTYTGSSVHCWTAI